VLAQNPRADIDGFFFPPNKDGLVWTDGTTQHGGSALYEVSRKKANHAETVKAFTVERAGGGEAAAEALGFLPALDVSSAGGVKLTNPQFVRVIKPALDANVKFDTSVSGRHSAERWKKKGTP
jgi:hypothetical protein